MAAFKDGDNATAPRQCPAIPGKPANDVRMRRFLVAESAAITAARRRKCRRKAVERLRAFEHPALDVFQRVLEADEAHPVHRDLAIRVAESMFDRTGHKQPEKLELESRQTIDVRTLSTGLLRQIAAELRQQEARARAPLTPGPTPMSDLRIDLESDKSGLGLPPQMTLCTCRVDLPMPPAPT
jgi:hypothetical protein